MVDIIHLDVLGLSRINVGIKEMGKMTLSFPSIFHPGGLSRLIVPY